VPRGVFAITKPLLPDALWDRIEPLLPPPRPPKRRDRIEDRRCQTGILSVLKTGINWEDLP
jgi:transposase